ncbi:hypothetical protein Tco_0940458 [Tanacetum coccineum]|uniref:Uncharacterized protein n=1 Tax=Tanacetum coccineum TaxID=301880 RepID=A0ABQ5DPT1_9ASTR
MPKFNKWLSSLLRNKEKLKEIAITTVNAECSAIIMNKVPENLEDPGKFLTPCALQELDRTSALADSRASINLLPYSIFKQLGLGALTPTRMTLELANPISIIDFSKEDPFSGSPTIPSNDSFPSSSPIKTSDSTSEEFTDEFALPNSLPPGDDVSILKKNLQADTAKDVEIKSSSSSTLTSPEASELEDYLEKDSIPPGIDLTIPSIFEVSSSNPTSPTLTGEKIICLLAAFLHKKPKTLILVLKKLEEINEDQQEKVSVMPYTIVMPIRITFDNPIDFNDHFSKPKDLKKDLTISFDSTTTSILPHPLLDSDSPFTAELSASVTLNSLGNEDKVFKPGILVYHAIHDKNLVTLEENLKENISSGTLLVFKEPSIFLPPPEPPDESLKNVVLNFYQSKKTFPLHVEDVNTFAFIIWTFLPFFTYSEESPLIFSFRSENFVFDPRIITFHNPVAVSMKVSHSTKGYAKQKEAKNDKKIKQEHKGEKDKESRARVRIQPEITAGSARHSQTQQEMKSKMKPRTKSDKPSKFKSSFGVIRFKDQVCQKKKVD